MRIDRAVFRRAVAMATVALAASSCGSETGSARAEGPSPPALAADAPLVGCGSFPYPPSAFTGPTGAEDAEDAAAVALRDLIANPDGIGEPATGWRRLLDDGDVVVFGSGEPRSDGSEQGLVEVAVRDDGEGFAFNQSAYGCTPRAAVPDRSVLEFSIVDGVELAPASTTIAVQVVESQCTGGAPVGGRLRPPLVRYAESKIEVLFTATPLEGKTFTCIGNPSSSTTLELDEPIGARHILDLSTYPPRDAAASGRLGGG